MKEKQGKFKQQCINYIVSGDYYAKRYGDTVRAYS